MPNLSIKKLLQLSKSSTDASKDSATDQTDCNRKSISEGTQDDSYTAKLQQQLLEAISLTPLNYSTREEDSEASRTQASLQDFSQCVSLVQSLYLIPEWISIDSERLLWKLLDQYDYRYKELRHRRTQKWGGDVTVNGLENVEPLPPWLSVLSRRLVEQGVFPVEKEPNHVLVNSYEADFGILPHTDGPAYYPVVAIVSLGCPCIFQFFKKARDCKPSESSVALFSLYIPTRSLFIFKDDAYNVLLHGIPDGNAFLLDENVYNVPSELKGTILNSGLRTSLTIRYVPIKE